MKFMDKDFLLSTETAKELYHNVAADTPILDYHCHLDAKEIAKDIRFENMTQLWLGADHYKWRQMRSNGIEEAYITGNAPDKEKFIKFASVLPKAIGNPLYHWSHMELQRYFDYHGILNEETAEKVWEICNRKLRKSAMSAKQLITDSGVTLVCTTDDPVDSLEWHRVIAEDKNFKVRVLPAWRPDLAIYPEKEGFIDYLKKLSKASGVVVNSFSSLCKALKVRLDFFAENGCVVSDHGVEYSAYIPTSEEECEEIFTRKINGNHLTEKECIGFQSACLLFLGREYSRLGWVMQLHYGAQRENDKELFRKAGANTGLDCIASHGFSSKAAFFLNALSETNELPKTIIYSLNPMDNAMIGTLIGCFQTSEIPGKIQHGSAWWFNDHKTGITEQLVSLANLSLLGNFIGMLTDSRSFLSYTRHEYFRRILCDFIGKLVENGEYPNDRAALDQLVRDISYNNAVRYFGFQL